MEENKRNFWNRPEGTTAKIAIGIGAIGLGFAFIKFLPLILAFVANTVSLVILCAVLFGIYLLATSSLFKSTVGLGFKTLMKMITSYIVNLDPIKILQEHVNRLKERLNEMTEQMSTVKGVTARLQSKLDKFKTDVTTYAAKAKHAQNVLAKKPKDRAAGNQYKLNLNKATRRKKTYEKLIKLNNKITKMYNTLLLMYDRAHFITLDTEDAVEALREEHVAVSAGASAVKQLKRILAGNAAEDDLYAEAWEVAEDQIFSAIGEIDSFMDTSEALIASYDEDNDSFDEDALKGFENWEETAASYLQVDVADVTSLEKKVEMQSSAYQKVSN